VSDTDNLSARRRAHPAGPAAASVELELQRLFYRKHAPRMLASLMRRGVRRVDAEEIVAITIAEVVRRWNDIDDPERYANTVAKHELIRQLTAKAEVPTADIVDLVGGSYDTTDDWVQINELYRLLALLPARQCQVLTLYVQYKCTPKEIAELLDITPAAARASLKKAKRTLANHLDSRSEQP
jgi:RNA polymerase sigma-70 factor (ECF subfamily)